MGPLGRKRKFRKSGDEIHISRPADMERSDDKVVLYAGTGIGNMYDPNSFGSVTIIFPGNYTGRNLIKQTYALNNKPITDAHLDFLMAGAVNGLVKLQCMKKKSSSLGPIKMPTIKPISYKKPSNELEDWISGALFGHSWEFSWEPSNTKIYFTRTLQGFAEMYEWLRNSGIEDENIDELSNQNKKGEFTVFNCSAKL